MEEINYISEEQIENFIYSSLVERGYVPGKAETQDLSEIVFDLLIEIGIIDEGTVDYYEVDED